MSTDPEKLEEGSRHEQSKDEITCLGCVQNVLRIILLCVALLCLTTFSGIMLVLCLLIIIIAFYHKAMASSIENKRYLLVNVIAMILDPLFFYIPVLNDEKKCIHWDKTMGITATVLRSVLDFHKLVHIISKLRKECDESKGKVFNDLWHQFRYLIEGEAYILENATVRKWMLFLIDILAILPIPQVMVIFGIRGTEFSTAMTFFVLQYSLRVIRTYFLYTHATEVSGILADATWAIFTFYLLLYLQSGHMFGALWYYYAIEKATDCWRQACKNHTGCGHSSFSCNKSFREYNFLNGFCTISTGSNPSYSFGLYTDALRSGIVEETNFFKKLLRCLRWGLQNLRFSVLLYGLDNDYCACDEVLYSAFGQNLQTSTDVGENIFAICMTNFGVVLFVFLIGRMQTETTRSQKINQKLQQIKQWKHFEDISTYVHAKIREAKRKKLLLKHDVHIDSLVSDLPDDIANHVKLHFGRKLLDQVQKFKNWDNQTLNHLYGCLKPVFFSERTPIIREGDTIHEMLFVLEGQLWTYSKAKLFGLKFQEAGNYCGEEIIDWAENGSSSHDHLPISTRTVIAHTKVEGFTLKADDLKHGVVLRHCNQLASFIQLFWRFKKYKHMQMKRRQSQGHASTAV